jgi:hypothetical protein
MELFLEGEVKERGEERMGRGKGGGGETDEEAHCAEAVASFFSHPPCVIGPYLVPHSLCLTKMH